MLKDTHFQNELTNMKKEYEILLFEKNKLESALNIEAILTRQDLEISESKNIRHESEFESEKLELLSEKEKLLDEIKNNSDYNKEILNERNNLLEEIKNINENVIKISNEKEKL